MLSFLRPPKKPGDAEMPAIGRAWQDRLVPVAPSNDPTVVFAIPLIAKKRATNWEQVCHNLAMTIGSLRRQSSDRWRAYICAQTAPEGVRFDDHVRFLPFRGLVYRPNEKGVRGWDKGDKRRKLLTQVMRDFDGRDGYYAQWDADDIVHPDAVAHAVTDNNGRGYLMEQGVMVDFSSGEMGWFGPETDDGRRKPLWRMCGSSSFVRFDFRTQPRLWKELLLRHSSHKRLVAWQTVHGLPLDPIPFPAGLYSYNNGENMSARKGDSARRNDYLSRNALSPQDAAQMRAAFGLDDLVTAAQK